MMFGWSHWRRMDASRKARLASSVLRKTSVMHFRATSSPVAVSVPVKTQPYAPLPALEWMAYRSLSSLGWSDPGSGTALSVASPLAAARGIEGGGATSHGSGRVAGWWRRCSRLLPALLVMPNSSASAPVVHDEVADIPSPSVPAGQECPPVVPFPLPVSPVYSLVRAAVGRAGDHPAHDLGHDTQTRVVWVVHVWVVNGGLLR